MIKLFFLLLISINSYSEVNSEEKNILMLSDYNKNALSYQMVCLATKSFLDNSYVKKNLAKNEEAFDHYLYNLDYNKTLMTQKQLDSLLFFKQNFYNNLSSSGILLSILSKKMINDNITKIKELINTKINNKNDLLINIQIETDPKKKIFVKDDNELFLRWIEKMSLDIIYHAYQLQKAKNDLKTEEAIQKAIPIVKNKMLTQLDKLYNENFDYFFQLFIDGVLGAQDPHSVLFIGQKKTNFFKSFKTELETFGIVYQINELEELEIVEVVPESAADKTNKINEGDILLGIEVNNKINYVVNFNSFQDFDEYIGSLTSNDSVFFHLLKKNSTKLKVPIKKEKSINTMANYTAGVLENNNIGYLKLQSFYNDFSNINSASSYEDVKKTIQTFNKKNIKHLIFDLRGNGGGLLVDGIKIAGLFIKNGPIVQVKSERDEKPQIDYDPDPNIYWDKPVTVLIDSRTASAAEIVAAALQDYNRALIVGENSFGKGSVQQVIDLNKLNYKLNKTNTLDATLKLTTQKFYRISGNSIQWTGVIPDISIFNANYLVGYEKELPNSLKSDTTTASSFDKWSEIIPISSLKSKSENRFNKNEPVKKIKNKIDEYILRLKNTKITMGFDYFKGKEEESKNIDDMINQLPKKKINIEFIKQANENQYANFYKKNNQKFKENLEKDIQLHEVLEIISDWNQK